MRRRAFHSLPFLVFATACVSVLPPHSAEVNKQLGTAVDALNEIDAATRLPGASTHYADLQPYWIKVFSGLASAERISAQRAEYSRGRLYSRPARISADTVRNCREVAEIVRAENQRRDALTSEDITAHGVLTTCTIPKLIEGNLKREG